MSHDEHEQTSDEDFKAFLRRRVFSNKYIWIVSAANFFVYTLRFAVFDWGATLLRAASVVDDLGLYGDEHTGAEILKRALQEPLRQLVANAGLEGSVVANKVKEGEGAFGFNAATGVYEDLLKAGVIDPAKVSRCALQNAASVASLMLTTEAMIAERPKDDEPKMPQGGGMGGMGM